MPKRALTFEQHRQLAAHLHQIASDISELAVSAGPKRMACETLKANLEQLRTTLDRTLHEDFSETPEAVLATIY